MINIDYSLLLTSYLIIFISLIDIAVAIHILLNKHDEPTSAILWLLLILFIPVMGVILYLFFGINRIYTLGIKIEIANNLLQAEKDSPIHAALFKHLEQEKRFIDREPHPNPAHYSNTFDRLLPGTRPINGNYAKLLFDGTMAYPLMENAIKEAKQSINLQSYIISNDQIGQKLLDTLEEKAATGVDVKLLYDGFGSGIAALSHFFSKYERSKIPNFQVHPFVISNILVPWRYQLRNHRKLLIVDGKTAFVGGINISQYNDINHCPPNKLINDLHCQIEGPVVSDLQYCFLRDWYYVTKTPPKDFFVEKYFPPLEEKGHSVIRVNASGPGQNFAATEKAFYIAVSTAKKYVWIMTPYLVPDKAFVKAICMAVAKGVEIRLLVPQNNNHWFVKFAAYSLYKTFLEAGVRIFEEHGPFVHAKAMIIDGEWAYMGSSNCDVRSFRLNYELDFAINGGSFMEEIHSQFLDKMSDSDEIQLSDVDKKSVPRQLVENACSLLTPIL